MGIWQDLVDRSGFTGAYETIKRYVRKLRGARTPEPRAVILTPAGEEAQAITGSGPVRDRPSRHLARLSCALPRDSRAA